MTKSVTSGKGFKDQQVGGAWQGGDRKAGRRRYGPGDLQYRRRKSGGPGAIVADIFFALLVLAFCVVGFVVLTAYLGSAVGKGSLLAVLSFLLVICGPLALALWAVRPMEGRRAFRWWLGVFGAPFILGTLALALVFPKRTSFVLHNYGAWIPELFAGRESNAARKTREYVDRVAALLHAVPEGGEDKGKGKAVEVVRPRPRKTRAKKVRYSGREWTVARRVDLAADNPPGKGIRVSFRRRGGTIIVRGTAGARSGGVTMLLDTGATLTTVSPEAAARLALSVPPGAPMVEVRTASGPAKYPAAVLPRLSLGKASVRNLTVLICAPCAHEGLSGLIGVNFIRHFVLTIDENRSRLTFLPRKERVNRAADVEPFLSFSRVTGADRGGVFRVEGEVKNTAHLVVRDVGLQAVLLDGDGNVLGRVKNAAGKPSVGRLKPGRSARFVVEGPGHASVEGFRVEVVRAFW